MLWTEIVEEFVPVAGRWLSCQLAGCSATCSSMGFHLPKCFVVDSSKSVIKALEASLNGKLTLVLFWTLAGTATCLAALLTLLEAVFKVLVLFSSKIRLASLH